MKKHDSKEHVLFQVTLVSVMPLECPHFGTRRRRRRRLRAAESGFDGVSPGRETHYFIHALIAHLIGEPHGAPHR